MATIVALDMEGVLTPEIWIAFADATGIPELRRTTRDEPDYDKLMRMRLGILTERNLRLPDIQQVIAGLGPLGGARAILDRLRREHEVVILSDTFCAHPRIPSMNAPRAVPAAPTMAAKTVGSTARVRRSGRQPPQATSSEVS